MSKKRTRQEKIKTQSRILSPKPAAAKLENFSHNVYQLVGYERALIWKDLLKTVIVSGTIISILIGYSLYY